MLDAPRRWFEEVRGKRLTAATKASPTKVVAVAQEQEQARDQWKTVGNC